jgi:hypothetical protein
VILAHRATLQPSLVLRGTLDLKEILDLRGTLDPRVFKEILDPRGSKDFRGSRVSKERLVLRAIRVLKVLQAALGQDLLYQ